VPGARRALQAAREARRLHSEECTLWDYECPDGEDAEGQVCRDCVATRLAVRAAKERLRKAQAKAGV
jgi:hypothetical protein